MSRSSETRTPHKSFLKLKSAESVESGIAKALQARLGRSDGCARNRPQPTDRVFPGNHRELFNTILTELDLKIDRDGNRRTAYSLRHSYICFRLMEGADIYQIAKNCRTSVEMIEKHYAAHIKNTLDAAAINVRRPKPGPAKSKQRQPV